MFCFWLCLCSLLTWRHQEGSKRVLKVLCVGFVMSAIVPTSYLWKFIGKNILILGSQIHSCFKSLFPHSKGRAFIICLCPSICLSVCPGKREDTCCELRTIGNSKFYLSCQHCMVLTNSCRVFLNKRNTQYMSTSRGVCL